MIRTAKVIGGARSEHEVAEYLPSNYHADVIVTPEGSVTMITGADVAGWTLDGYVIPRLASGMIFAEEVC
jgi:hypothetical protein